MTIEERYSEAKTWHERALILQIYHNLMCSQVKGWTVRMTAKKLDRSSGYVSEDIRLAEAIKKYPKILQAADRQKALKMMKDYVT